MSETSLMAGTTTAGSDRSKTTIKDIENACLDIALAHPEPALRAILVHSVDWPSIDGVLKRARSQAVLGGLPVYVWRDGDERLLDMFGGQVPEPGKVVAKYSMACLRIAANIIKRRLEESCSKE